MDNQNVYSVLGLRKGATEKEIKDAYVELIKKFDPEKHTDRFMVIEAAYDKLRHPAKRAREDILAFNHFKGRFLFSEDEKTNEPDAQLNQFLIRAQEAFKAAPDNPENRAVMIRLLMCRTFKKVAKRLWAEAIEDWQTILKIDPGFARAKNNILYSYLALGYSYAEHNLYAEAVELWEKAAQMDPEDEQLIHNLAIAHELTGKQEEAKRYWAEVLKLWQARLETDPEDIYTKNLMIELRRHHGGQSDDQGKTQGPASIEEYREILKINPDDFEAQYKISLALYEQHDWKQAIENWMTLLHKHPKNIEAMNMLGWSYLNAGMIEEAFATWNRSLAMDPKNPTTQEAIIKARMSVGRAFRNRGLYTQALVHFKALLRSMPNSSEVYMEIGETYLQKGDKRSAAECFERAMKIDPKNREAKQRLSEMKLRA